MNDEVEFLNDEIEYLNQELRDLKDEVQRLKVGEKWAASKFCEIMAVAISGLSDTAIIAQAKYNADHALAAVEQLAAEANRMREELNNYIWNDEGLIG